jgi:hypothetical protein
MIAVRVVEPAIDQVIDVVAVGHRFVAAVRAVHVARFVAVRGVRAAGRILLTDLEVMLFDRAVRVLMVEVVVVEVIDVIAMADRGVAAAGSVLVVVIGVAVGFLIHRMLTFTFQTSCPQGSIVTCRKRPNA